MRVDSNSLVGIGEIADRYGVRVNVVSNWYARGKLPTPLRVLKCGPIWDAAKVAKFIEKNSEKSNTKRNVSAKVKV